MTPSFFKVMLILLAVGLVLGFVLSEALVLLGG